MKKKFKLKLTHHFIALVSVFTYIVMISILKEYYQLNELNTQKHEFKNDKFTELSNRIYLLTTFLVFISMSIGIIIYNFFNLWEFNIKRRRFGSIILYISLFSFGCAIIIAQKYYNNKPVIRSLFEDIAQLNTSFIEFEVWSYSHINNLINIITAVTIVLIPALIVGGISCLDKYSDKTPHSFSIESWKFQVERFQTNIFMSAAVLAAGVLYSKALTHYPAAFISDNPKEFKASYLQLADSLTVYTGMMYSMILASYAIPVAIILSRRAKSIARNTDDANKPKLESSDSQHQIDLELREYRKEKGLVMTVRDVLQTIIALVAPLLTGAISSVYKALG